jgi:NTP pyrophosphatase (non-canonical NTP hydrolase)
MNFTEFQAAARRTQNRKITSSERLQHAKDGMVAELGEIHGMYQKAVQGHMIDCEKLMLELGDLLWFIAEFCDENAWMLDDVAQKNVDKLRARYPEGFDSARSVHRDEAGVLRITGEAIFWTKATPEKNCAKCARNVRLMPNDEGHTHRCRLTGVTFGGKPPAFKSAEGTCCTAHKVGEPGAEYDEEEE